ncbi:THUMP-like domain-containing protein [Sporichthya polymorpha]|uniref:THUMP-like domain-containing protein n=1 Tax=Sporichthya polymorpha TaxID=35751 RepID=UPI0003A8140B|nr:SAM-dependent methyltransferase [Sporichthya polymorpha]
MDLAVFRALQGSDGATVLAELAGAGPLDDAAALRLGTRLRREHPAEFVAAALTQARLRERAVAKFGPAAARMWFTPAGLEQATHPVVAAHRAARVAAALGPGAPVFDLCCGIGTDSLALRAAGLTVTAVDADTLTAAVAAANLTLGSPGTGDDISTAGVVVGDVREVDLGGAAVFVDPARRAARGRVFDPDAYSPPWSFVRELLRRPATVAKVAPGIPHNLPEPGVAIEWVSLRGEVKEAALYSPGLAAGLADGARRRATLLPGGQTLSAAGPDSEEEPPPVGDPGRFLYEPDGAVIRAHLVGAVVEAVDGRLLDPTIAYVTADTHVPTPFATAYEVTDVLPFSVSRLRAVLRERGVGVVVVKKRGVDVLPEQLRRDLLRGARGSAEATVVVTRHGRGRIALLVRPVSPPLSDPAPGA